MRAKKTAAWLAAFFILLRLLLPGTARRIGTWLQGALFGEGWQTVETLGRSVAKGTP